MSDGSLPAKTKTFSNQAKPRFVNIIRPGRLDVEFVFECIKGLRLWGNGSNLHVKSEKGIIEETFAAIIINRLLNGVQVRGEPSFMPTRFAPNLDTVPNI